MTGRALSDYERGILISGMSPGSAGMMLGRSAAWVERQRANMQALAAASVAEAAPLVSPEPEPEPAPEPASAAPVEPRPAAAAPVVVAPAAPVKPQRAKVIRPPRAPEVPPVIAPRPRPVAAAARDGEFGLYSPAERGDHSPALRLERDGELVEACLSAGGFPRIHLLRDGRVVWLGPDGLGWRPSQSLRQVGRRATRRAGASA